jgi:hypothetical protein
MDINDNINSRTNPPTLPENFRDSLNNLSMNERNIKNYLLYLYKWTNDIIQKPKNPEILNKYVDTAFAFLRDLQKYPNLREMTYDYENNTITTSYIVNKIKETNKFIIDNLQTGFIKNQPKFREMNINLNSNNFKGGIRRKTLKRRTNKKPKKTYKKRRVNKRRK